MDSIDLHDLPQDQAQLVATYVEFLRRKLCEGQEVNEAGLQEQEWGAGAAMSYAYDWENDEDAIYDNWREHYHVSERHYRLTPVPGYRSFSREDSAGGGGQRGSLPTGHR
ncbi:MAG TPA: hypothetical protein VLK82_05370 [Candidatus Tectomicrobia bacterium]|nr:hypothetical protein [Candidatus Tectomicrobia bacterium]